MSSYKEKQIDKEWKSHKKCHLLCQKINFFYSICIEFMCNDECQFPPTSIRHEQQFFFAVISEMMKNNCKPEPITFLLALYFQLNIFSYLNLKKVKEKKCQGK